MPVYEFYCENCHVIFNFLSRQVNTDKKPACPRCGRPDLEKQVSAFAISKNRPEEPDGMPDFDETRMEQAMMAMASEMEGINEDDPKAMAHFMRKFSKLSGISLGDGMEEALSRLEAGEDPEQLEAEMGDLLEGEELFSKKGLNGLKKKYLPPEQDETLYTL